MLHYFPTHLNKKVIPLPAPELVGRRASRAVIDILYARMPGRSEIAEANANRHTYLLRKGDLEIRLPKLAEAIDRVEPFVARLYRQRSYDVVPIRATGNGGEHDPRAVVLEACLDDRTVGTLTVNLDGPKGLLGEVAFGDEIAPYRRRGSRLCEFTRFAMEIGSGGRRPLASLFHMAFILAYRIHQATELFIEVNPRHAAFYVRQLGFRVIGEVRLCRRVNAPAVLLHRGLRDLAGEVVRLGGLKVKQNRSLYAAGFSPCEESDVIADTVRVLARPTPSWSW